MIKYEAADKLHQELLQAATDEIVSAVLALHCPVRNGSGPFDWPRCNGCVGTIQGDSPVWPDDCETTKVIARRLGVEL